MCVVDLEIGRSDGRSYHKRREEVREKSGAKGGGEKDGSEIITLCNSHLLWRAPTGYRRIIARRKVMILALRRVTDLGDRKNTAGCGGGERGACFLSCR